MKSHTFKIPAEELLNLTDLNHAISVLFDRLNLDLRSDEHRDRKLAEVSCSPPTEHDPWFTVRYYTEQFRRSVEAEDFPVGRHFRGCFVGDGPIPPPYSEEELVLPVISDRPVPARPRRVRANSFIDPYGQCAEPVPLPEYVSDDCGQVTASPA